uniref:(northern house mosquito) hypothetical protein n=1 Tax=Culex pipiens TaxID=7175 RepID=A0A8D8CDP8_CULPI
MAIDHVLFAWKINEIQRTGVFVRVAWHPRFSRNSCNHDKLLLLRLAVPVLLGAQHGSANFRCAVQGDRERDDDGAGFAQIHPVRRGGGLWLEEHAGCVPAAGGGGAGKWRG